MKRSVSWLFGFNLVKPGVSRFNLWIWNNSVHVGPKHRSRFFSEIMSSFWSLKSKTGAGSDKSEVRPGGLLTEQKGGCWVFICSLHFNFFFFPSQRASFKSYRRCFVACSSILVQPGETCTFFYFWSVPKKAKRFLINRNQREILQRLCASSWMP